MGGTNLKAGLTDETGRLLAAARRPWTPGAETLRRDLRIWRRRCSPPPERCPGTRRAWASPAGAVSGGEVLYTTNIPLERTGSGGLAPPAAGPASAAGQRRGLCCRRGVFPGRGRVCGTSWC
ncbi:MAG: hypothetical protein ACLTYN_07545 [Dysosmobacter welbionis]